LKETSQNVTLICLTIKVLEPYYIYTLTGTVSKSGDVAIPTGHGTI